MLNHVEAFALAFAGCAATNLDNILLVLAAGSQSQARRYALLFFAVLGMVILAAFGLSLGMDVVLPKFLAWIGLIPLGMGLFELLPRRGSDPNGRAVASSLAGFTALLAANSLDTLLVQTILFSDSASSYHIMSLSGSIGAAALLASAAFVLLSHPGSASRLLPLAARARPWMLMAVGLLIFMDTGFDTQ